MSIMTKALTGIDGNFGGSMAATIGSVYGRSGALETAAIDIGLMGAGLSAGLEWAVKGDDANYANAALWGAASSVPLNIAFKGVGTHLARGYKPGMTLSEAYGASIKQTGGFFKGYTDKIVNNHLKHYVPI